MDRLDAVWRSFLRLSAGERREFIVMLRERLAEQRAARRIERGTDADYRQPPKRFSDLSLEGQTSRRQRYLAMATHRRCFQN